MDPTRLLPGTAAINGLFLWWSWGKSNDDVIFVRRQEHYRAFDTYTERDPLMLLPVGDLKTKKKKTKIPSIENGIADY